MKKILPAFLIFVIAFAVLFLSILLFSSSCSAQDIRVKTGLEVLRESGFQELKGKRVGLITNPTGVDRELRSGVDILYRAPGVKLVALYGPEHGVRGEYTAGEIIGSSVDPATGLKVYSLYGSTRKPTKAMLEGIDVLVYDIQDIGSRSYTFISTLGLAMEAAAENRIPFVVLDRPNPNGHFIDGAVLQKGISSFVGMHPIPVVHGCTLGELALMINGEGWLKNSKKCKLSVIPVSNY